MVDYLGREQPEMDWPVDSTAGEILVFANKHNGRNPEFLGLVLLEALSDNLRLADICARRAGQRITTG